jgi:trimeric autotransporter adhesin
MTGGDIYTIAGGQAAGFTGDGGLAVSAKLNDPTGVALTAAGDLLIADSGNGRIRLVTG